MVFFRQTRAAACVVVVVALFLQLVLPGLAEAAGSGRTDPPPTDSLGAIAPIEPGAEELTFFGELKSLLPKGLKKVSELAEQVFKTIPMTDEDVSKMSSALKVTMSGKASAALERFGEAVDREYNERRAADKDTDSNEAPGATETPSPLQSNVKGKRKKTGKEQSGTSPSDSFLEVPGIRLPKGTTPLEVAMEETNYDLVDKCSANLSPGVHTGNPTAVRDAAGTIHATGTNGLWINHMTAAVLSDLAYKMKDKENWENAKKEMQAAIDEVANPSEGNEVPEKVRDLFKNLVVKAVFAFKCKGHEPCEKIAKTWRELEKQKDYAVNIGTFALKRWNPLAAMLGFLIEKLNGKLKPIDFSGIFAPTAVVRDRVTGQTWVVTRGTAMKERMAELVFDLAASMVRNEDVFYGAGIHAGFKMILDAKQVAERVKQWLHDNEETKGIYRTVHFCGHSLGGALAVLQGLSYKALSQNDEEKALAYTKMEQHYPAAVYTFGCPRVGDWLFARQVAHIPHFRFVREQDIVPAVPFVDASVLDPVDAVKQNLLGSSHVNDWYIHSALFNMHFVGGSVSCMFLPSIQFSASSVARAGGNELEVNVLRRIDEHAMERYRLDVVSHGIGAVDGAENNAKLLKHFEQERARDDARKKKIYDEMLKSGRDPNDHEVEDEPKIVPLPRNARVHEEWKAEKEAKKRD